MPDTPKFILGIDLDGVCADFYGGIRCFAAEWLGKDENELVRDVSFNLKEWGIDQAPGGYADAFCAGVLPPPLGSMCTAIGWYRGCNFVSEVVTRNTNDRRS